MSQFNPTEVLYFKNYYCYNEELYTSTFPLEWVKNQLPNTGPKECVSCSDVGMWNGVFIGYCLSCANSYEGKRGPGFVECGVECSIGDTSYCAYNTYLKNVKNDDIGDKEVFMDSQQVYEGKRYGNMILQNYKNEKKMRQYHEDRRLNRFKDYEKEMRELYEESRLSQEEDELMDRYYNPKEYSVQHFRSCRCR